MSSSGSGSGTGQSPSWANAAQRTDGIPPKIDAQLTEGERQALIAVRSKVRYAQRIGNVSGAAAVYYWMQVRKKGKYSWFSTLGYSVVGSLLVGGLAMPLGVMWGQSDIASRVENQDHFKKVLENAARNKQAAQGQQGGPPMPNQTSTPTMPNVPAPMPSNGPSRNPQRGAGPDAGTNKWGDESFDDSALYANTTSPSSYEQNSASMSAGNDTFGRPSDSGNPSVNSQPAQDAQSNSRWAQLRGERSGNQQSSWDRVRTQNAQQQSQPSQPDQSASAHRSDVRYDSNSSPSTSINADPTFGKGINPQRAQAQRDYEASFERERRGVDG